MNIDGKEMWAVAKSLPAEIQDCRVDIQVDNQAIINTWHGRGSRFSDITRVAQRIFTLVTERSADLSLVYVPSEMNAADWFSHDDFLGRRPCCRRDVGKLYKLNVKFYNLKVATPHASWLWIEMS